MSATEIKIGGLGGQGVILAGMIIGRGASIYDNKYATLTQAFGPEARGSACSAQIIVSGAPVAYPYVHHPHILVVMSQEAYVRFVPELVPDGLLLYESDLVQPRNLPAGVTHYGIPSTRFAEEFKRPMVSNIVMVGFFGAMCSLVTVGALRQSVEASVPPGTETLNLAAFDRGLQFGRDLFSHKPATVAQRPT
ncbi:MAG TPA: 2-oxoacid:acceptor oxidoreductase family protein [Phycisphaerae bacterium]|nr:2-oxoacid:acceptor oxidoreductase family protein [Phycisphaerae bacterium]HNU46460.1 2-oxoacid:acceptor oxidoreductase family protein [Phycisphaerae bacterium]